MEIEEFILIGHSFGGYIGTFYAQKYKHVKQLELISPCGLTRMSDKCI